MRKQRHLFKKESRFWKSSANFKFDSKSNILAHFNQWKGGKKEKGKKQQHCIQIIIMLYINLCLTSTFSNFNNTA